ncbi:MAG: diguanylate cyclase [Desulfobacteraceae bacterium]|nr:diguanylate cyclase [Desulfobacteraceae bacterium]
MNAYRIKSRIFIPLTLAFSFLLIAFGVGYYRFKQVHVMDEVVNRLKSLEALFQVQLDSDAGMMGAALEVILKDDELKDALEASDRRKLLMGTSDLYERLRSRHRITHFYFSGPDRVNILRVHKPDKFGDRIDRFTTLAAEQTGRMASGIELGPLGTFTLRVVAPWHDGEKLIGYVELGEEIEHIIDKLHQILGVDIYILIEKRFLVRGPWETGMRLFGHEPDWERFPAMAMISQTSGIFPEQLKKTFSGEHSPSDLTPMEIIQGDQRFQTRLLEMKDAGGRVVGTMVVARDITDLEGKLRNSLWIMAGVCIAIASVLYAIFWIFLGRVEEQIQQTNLHLIHIQKAMDSASDAFILSDTRGKPLYLNPAFSDLFGYSLEDLNKDQGVSPFQPKPGWDDPVRSFVQPGQPRTGEMTVRAQNGRMVKIFARVDSVYDEAEKIIGTIAVYSDITERKETEQALRESEERFRTIAVTARDAIATLDNDGNISYWNSAAEMILGYSAEEVMGKNLHTFLPPSKYVEAHLTEFPRFQQSGEGNAVGKTLELEAIRKDGTVIPVELSLSSFQSKGQWCALGILRDITDRKKVEAELRSLSVQDGLTHVSNRRFFDEKLDNEWKRMTREKQPLSLIMCDIDYFKSFNDTYGHQMGDDVLKKVATTLNSTIKRPGDLLARYGGEEFVVVLPNTDANGAALLAETLRNRVESLNIEHRGAQVRKVVTLSLGVATMIPSDGSAPEQLISEADKALYQAKNAGRNQVCAAPPA